MRLFIADTFALVAFSTIIGAFIEIVVAGLDVETVVAIRFAAIPITLLTARPYGMYRDFLFRLTSAHLGGQLKAGIVDTIANVSFQLPVYVTLLALNGATFAQIAKASSSVFVIILVGGRPYGLFLVWCRRLFGA